MRASLAAVANLVSNSLHLRTILVKQSFKIETKSFESVRGLKLISIDRPGLSILAKFAARRLSPCFDILHS